MVNRKHVLGGMSQYNLMNIHNVSSSRINVLKVFDAAYLCGVHIAYIELLVNLIALDLCGLNFQL